MIGLIPAAGRATRIQKLPKFLLPCPGGYLLQWHLAGLYRLPVEKVAIGTNAETFEQMSRYAKDSACVYSVESRAMPETLLAARPYIDIGQVAVMVMPDTFWLDATILHRLVSALLNNARAVVAAALWEVTGIQRTKLGMCRTDAGRITALEDKPLRTDLTRAWGVIAWRRDFWAYMDEHDLHMGVALQRAIDAKEQVLAVEADGPYYDCGTTDEYFAMIRAVTAPEVTL